MRVHSDKALNTKVRLSKSDVPLALQKLIDVKKLSFSTLLPLTRGKNTSGKSPFKSQETVFEKRWFCPPLPFWAVHAHCASVMALAVMGFFHFLLPMYQATTLSYRNVSKKSKPWRFYIPFPIKRTVIMINTLLNEIHFSCPALKSPELNTKCKYLIWLDVIHARI